MKRVKYLILGAGPSGLAVATALLQDGESSIAVLEQLDEPGGLCRSQEVDGSPLDVGGGHFLDTCRKEVLDFLFTFMPRGEWNAFERVSKIRLRKQEIDHPLEANLWQFAEKDQEDFLGSIARAGCVRGLPTPASFSDWVVWKFGERIAEEYMLPYNRKIWSLRLEELGTYWLYKLPDVSYEETLRSCREKRSLGKLPAHGAFLYPRHHGYGEIWKRMGRALKDKLVLSCPVTSLDLEKKIVNDSWQAETIISTIPWTIWPKLCKLPDEVLKRIECLRHVALNVDYCSSTISTSAHWTYEPDETIRFHRMLFRSNFCMGSRGYWTETNALRSSPEQGWRYRNEYAYPVNTCGKPEAIQEILLWARRSDIIGLGRWGTWEHMNSDVAVAKALDLAASLCKGHGVY